MLPILSAEPDSMSSILIVEDERKLAHALREGLEAEQFDARTAHTGEEGFALASREAFALVILDLMLPRRGGIEVLSSLRTRGMQTPVLVLTAKDTVEDRVQALDLGADDYLVKPFAFAELLARIRALLRRGRALQRARMSCEDLELDVGAHTVARGSRRLNLTAKEFEILEYLLRHAGSIVSREMLARDVWRVASRATPLDNVIDVTIARLRRKLDEPSGRRLLHTVRGVGFILGKAPH
jgi:DNA-binding response OmpR family regulator